jgi:tol-pal system protein YbgF
MKKVILLLAAIAFSSEASAQNAVADLQLKVSELETTIQNLTGQVEENQFKLRKIEKNVINISGDLGMQINEIKEQQRKILKTLKAMQSQPQPAQKAQTQQAKPAPLDVGPIVDVSKPKKTKPQFGENPEKHYEIAYNYLQKGDFLMAEEGFKSFLKKYPKHELSDNAGYWLGESYYAKGDFERAAVAFADGYKKYPNSNKTPDYLLKLGYSMENLNKQKEACTAFLYITNELKNSAPKNIVENAKREVKKLKCE